MFAYGPMDSGTATIYEPRIRVSGAIYTNATWGIPWRQWDIAPAAQPLRLPKNWRWFDVFRTIDAAAQAVRDACEPFARLLRRMLMRCPVEARRHKRKQLVQRMRGAA